MRKGVGIAAMIIAIIAIFIPIYSIFISAIAIVLATASGLGGERVFSVATPIISVCNLLFLSPATLAFLLAASEKSGNLILPMVLAAAMLPIVAVSIHASGVFRTGRQ